MNHRTVARLAWPLWALSLTFTALGLLLLVLNLSHPEVPVYSFWAENVLLSVGFSTVGAVIVPRMPAVNRIGWLFCAIGLLWAVLQLSGEYAIYALLAAPGSLPAGTVASWIYSWPWVPGLGLTVMLALVYFGGVTATQEIFQTLTGQVEQPQLTVVASTLVIAALFTPSRRRIQSFIDRRFCRRKYDARKTVESFYIKLRDEMDLDALSDDQVVVVGETMKPAHVSLWLRPPQDGMMQSRLRESEVQDV